MSIYSLTSLLLVLAVLIAYLNHRFIRMQTSIAIMFGALLISLMLLLVAHLGYAGPALRAEGLLVKTNFRALLLNGMLSFLLFAGALTIDIEWFKRQRVEIATLASVSTIASALLIAVVFYWGLLWFGLQLPFVYCLLFGALISPTDPIAVLATFKKVGAPQQLQVCIAGESLFNDGVGIVMFVTFLGLLGSHAVTVSSVVVLFLREALGGILYGFLVGVFLRALIRTANSRHLSVLLSVAMVAGSYSLALMLKISGPLAMVVAGMVVGHFLRTQAAPAERESMILFWDVIDELLNAILFLLVGFELLSVHLSLALFMAMLAAIPAVLCVRWLTVAVPMRFFKQKHPLAIRVLTWGGLRGGLAVALALSLPVGHAREIILGLTYGIVVFSIIIQGSTIKALLRSH